MHTTPTTGVDLGLNTTSHLQRTDPTAPDLNLEAWLVLETDATYINSTLEHVLALTTQHWSTTTIPTAGLQTCLNTLTGFLEDLLNKNVTTLDAITEAHVQEFINNAPTHPGPHNTIANPVRHLRRNVLAALSTTAQAYGRPLIPVPPLAAAKTSKQRPSTHDEVLLLRLTADLIRSQRTVGLSAAVLAALTSGATPNETASLRPENLRHPELALPGLSAETPGKVIQPRSVPLDGWASHTFRLYLEHGYDGHSPYALYTGRRAPTSNSAQVSISNQLKKIAEHAGIHHHGVTTTGLRLWAALRDNTEDATFCEAARRYGTHWTTLQHHVFRTSDRRHQPIAA